MKEKEITITQNEQQQESLDSIDADILQGVGDSDIKRRVEAERSRRYRQMAKRAQNRKKKKRLTTLAVIASILLMLFVIGWGISRIGFNAEKDPDLLVDDIVEDKVSVLLVGTDGDGYNTDTIMLALMDCKNHTINIMSIPRDTRVPNPYGGNSFAKINSVYAAKGMAGLIKQIGDITGLPINFYVKINFEGFRKAIDALGGVEFNVPIRLYYQDPEQDLYIDLHPGLQRLNGDKAEQLVRARNQYAQADIKRTEIQREFLKELIKQHATTANLFKVGDLYNIMSNYVTTNITLGDAIKYAPSLTKISDENIQMYILPGTTNEGGISYWLYDAKQMETLANDVFWYDVKLKPTPRPVYTPTPSVSPSPEPSPSLEPSPSPKDDTPSTTTPKPSTTSKPTTTPKPNPTATPRPTATPKPTVTPKPNNPNEYPEGI